MTRLSRPSTPAERAVLAYAAAVILAMMGAVAFYFSWFGGALPPAAIQLRVIGVSCCALAAGIVLLRWAIAFLLDD